MSPYDELAARQKSESHQNRWFERNLLGERLVWHSAEAVDCVMARCWGEFVVVSVAVG